MNTLILASSSQRRLELLAQVGLRPNDVVAPDIDESYFKNELPKDYSARIAAEKARKVASMFPESYVLSADTVACCGRRILPKAESEEQAIKSLHMISGRRHRVYTSVCLMTPEGRLHIREILSVVKFKRLSVEEINFYIASKQWVGRAGACNLQGIAGMFVSWIQGSHSAILGLPLYETYCLLSQYFKICDPSLS